MSDLQSSLVKLEHGGVWSAQAAPAGEGAPGLASSWFAAPGFFIAWIGIGVGIGLALARRGHERRTMVALGAGLGPLMVLVASETVKRRERLAQPLVLSPGVDRGGRLDVIVLVRDRPEDVEFVALDLSAVRSEVGLVTLANVVDFECLDAGPDDAAVRAASNRLVAARDLLPTAKPRLVVCPGTDKRAVQHLSREGQRTLVLHAVAKAPPRAGLG